MAGDFPHLWRVSVGVDGNFSGVDQDSLITFGHLYLSFWEIYFGTPDKFIVCDTKKFCHK